MMTDQCKKIFIDFFLRELKLKDKKELLNIEIIDCEKLAQNMTGKSWEDLVQNAEYAFKTIPFPDVQRQPNVILQMTQIEDAITFLFDNKNKEEIDTPYIADTLHTLVKFAAE